MKKSPKRILQVVGAMNMGGTETFLMNVMRSIDRQKYQFVFLCYISGPYDYEEEIKELGGIIVRIRDTRISNPLGFIANIRSVIKEEAIDIVHSHVDFSSGYAMLAARDAGIERRILHAHSASASSSRNIIKNIPLRCLKWSMNRYATDYVACGEEAGRFMFGKNIFITIRNGINVDRFHFNPTSRKEIRSQIGIDTNDTVLLHIGRFEAVKNHTFLIDIFNEYRKLNNSTKLILLGDGSLFQSIKNKVDELNLNNNIYMLGKRVNTEDYYSASDLLIMPSIYEGMPVTLIEAQAGGLGALVSSTIDRSIDYGGIAFYPLESSAKEWAGRIKPPKRDRKQISSLLSKDYDIKEIAIQLEGLYETE